MKVSEYVANFVADLGVKQVYSVTGGGAMYLNDALGSHPDIQFVATHHEQSASMAAEGHARITNKMSVLHVTTGPGGTNAVTGVAGAFIDSIPMLVISGQVTMPTLIGNSPLRQLGVQEIDILSIVKPITKYAEMVTEPKMIRYHLEKAVHYANSGRPGPVWLDIPLDIQGAHLSDEDINDMIGYVEETPLRNRKGQYLSTVLDKTIQMLSEAKRPVIIPGYGVRLANASDDFLEFVEKFQIPVISSWNASDLMSFDDPCYIGRAGLFGSRAGNFTVQNADLILAVGSRMSIPQVGHASDMFAPHAKHIIVDIDEAELSKPTLRPDLPVQADAKKFIEGLNTRHNEYARNDQVDNWVTQCQAWKKRYPIVQEEYRDQDKDHVNSFLFIEQLSKRLPEGAIVVTDMGTSFTCTMQTFETKKDQRLFTSSGLASMGFGFPAAIGACFAANQKRVININGDGGFMFNIQELQTVAHHNLPITIFVLENEGYLTMKLMQENHFKGFVGADPSSGVSIPDFVKVAESFGVPGMHIRTTKELEEGLDKALSCDGPLLVEIHMEAMQALIPRVQTQKNPDGSLKPPSLEVMFPFLDEEEFNAQMIAAEEDTE